MVLQEVTEGPRDDLKLHRKLLDGQTARFKLLCVSMAVGFVVCVAGCGATQRHQNSASACRMVSHRMYQAGNYLDGQRYREALAASVSGLKYTRVCDDDDLDTAARGPFMAVKAISEYKLSFGDGKKDLMQAIPLLEDCESDRGVYGRLAASDCHLMRETAIRLKPLMVSPSCVLVQHRLDEATTQSHDGEYQKAFGASVSGLTYVEHCDDEDFKTRAEAMLMIDKALAERKLSSGDSETDLNEAITFLETCQTNPKFYGTHTGAECESIEDDATRLKTSWEMESY
jgi:hypothetical protein